MSKSPSRRPAIMLLLLTLLSLLASSPLYSNGAIVMPDPTPLDDALASTICSAAAAPVEHSSNNIIVPHPSDPHKFIACCSSLSAVATPFVCHGDAVPGFELYEYSPAFRSDAAVFDPIARACVSSTEKVVTTINVDSLCADVLEAEKFYNRSIIPRRRLAQVNTMLSSFELIINPQRGRSSTGVIAIHAALMPRTDSVHVVSRPLARRFSYEPGIIVASDGAGELSTLYHTNNGTYTVKPIREAPFCMGAVFLSDGTLFTAGGQDAAVPFPPYLEGRNVVRRFSSTTMLWNVSSTRLRDFHWYPTLVYLPDDRVLIVNGFRSEFGSSAPHRLELYDVRADRVMMSTLSHPMAANDMDLYPTMYLLPWRPLDSPTSYAIFAARCWTTLIFTVSARDPAGSDATTIAVLRGAALPRWPSFWSVAPFCGPSSGGGTAAMLMLEPGSNYAPDVAMFGGIDNWAPNPACVCDRLASPWTMRLRLDRPSVMANTTRYVRERMPSRRYAADAVTLPTGQVIIVNGAQSGRSAGTVDGGGQSRTPVLNAWLYTPSVPLPVGYDPDTTVSPRFMVLAASTIVRYYHSTALLLPDASVLVAGSEQGAECFGNGCTGVAAPAVPEYRAEKFKPPYFFGAFAARRPIIMLAYNPPPNPLKYGWRWSVAHTGDATHAVLVAPGAVTHQINMNQRVIRLASVVDNSTFPGVRRRLLTMPPTSIIAPPGWYMMFLVNNDAPSTRGVWLRLSM